MSDELKPCPFCGDEPTLRKSGALKNAQYMAMCARSCGACNGWKDTVDEAIAAWNTRQEPDDLIRTVKTRINELEEQIEENCTYRSRELVNHEIVVLKWVLSLRKPEAHS